MTTSCPARSRGHRRLRAADLPALERGAAYLAAFLAPVPTLRLPGIFFTASDMLFCACLFLLLFSGILPRQPLGRATLPWSLAFAMLGGGLLLSSMLQGDVVRALVVIAQYFFAYILLLFVVLRRDETEAYRMAGCFIIGLILFVDLHGIIIFYTVGYRPGSMIVSGARRLVTILGDANLAAAVNALTLPTMLHLWLCGRIPSLLAVPMLAVVAVTIVLTGSFGGFLTASLSLAVFLGTIMDRRLFGRVLLMAGIGAGALYAGGADMLPEAFRNRVLGALSSGDLSQAGTLEDRAKLIYEALDIIAQRGIFLVGLGADQFRIVSVQGAPVHNVYVLLWVEGGVFALIGWLLFLVIGLILGLVARRLGVSRYTGATMMATVAVLAFVANTNPHMYARFWLMPFLLTLGLVMAELRGKVQADVRPTVAPSATRRSVRGVGRAAAVAVVLLVASSGVGPSARADPGPSVEEVRAALRRAAVFMRERAVAQGGYGWSYSADLTERRGEGLITNRQGWVQKPGIPSVGIAYLQAHEATGEGYFLEAAHEAGTMLVRTQLRSGGWWYMAEFDPGARQAWCYRVEPDCRRRTEARENDHRNASTFDDDTTQNALGFLIRLDRALATSDPALRESIEYGLDKVMAAQYANGAWPFRLDRPSAEAVLPGARARYPESWSRAYVPVGGRTFYAVNDYLVRDGIRLFLLAHWAYQRQDYLETARRAGEFLLAARMPEPQPGWAQQYNRSMEPIWGRKFEPPAIASRETAGNVDALLDLYLYTGEERWLEATVPAVRWLERVRLPDGDWARFYELETDVPLYVDSTYRLSYSDADTPSHYGFKSQIGIPEVMERYRRVTSLSRQSYLADLRSQFTAKAYKSAVALMAVKILEDLDKDGRWIENGKIYSGTFIQRFEALAKYLVTSNNLPLIVGNLFLELQSKSG